MAKILLSIYPEYTNAIFSGIKTAEFRRKVVNELLEGGSHTLYFYETKKNGGAGKVVGQADVKEVFVTLQAAYMPSGLQQLDGLSVKKMQQLYLCWCRQREKAPARWWYSDSDFAAYRNLIGWTGDPKHYYNYVLNLENVQKYDTPLMFPALHMKAAKRLHVRHRICVSAYLPDFAAAKIRHIDFVKQIKKGDFKNGSKKNLRIRKAAWCIPLRKKRGISK